MRTYATLIYADALLAKQYQGADFWATHTSGDRQSALDTASLQFDVWCTDLPTEDPSPEWLQVATCLQALYILRLDHDTTYPREHMTLGLSKDEDGNVFDHGFAPMPLCSAVVALMEANGVTVTPPEQTPRVSTTLTIRS